jgi:hypothetical protein
MLDPARVRIGSEIFRPYPRSGWVERGQTLLLPRTLCQISYLFISEPNPNPINILRNFFDTFLASRFGKGRVGQDGSWVGQGKV